MLSIIIPVYNNLEMTYECIQNIRETTKDCEIIVIDNGSSPEYKATFTGFIPISVIRNEENKGFPIAVNQGIEKANGDVIILLNNDVIVTKNALNIMAGYLEEFDIIGPMTNYCAGLQQLTLPAYNNTYELNKEAGFLAELECVVEEVNFIIGFCMVFKKSLYDELGKFDESLWPCSGEEIDFCFKAREKGYKIGIAHNVYVHHYGSQTFKDMQESGQINYAEVCTRNDKHLAEKWGVDFWHQQAIRNIRLNLGCGQFQLKGFINVDQFRDVNPDLVCDVRKLPFEPGSVDEIYCGHLLEHLTGEEGRLAVKYWWSLLKPGGTIYITVPDFDVLLAKYQANPSANAMREFNDIFIYSYIQDSPHKYSYNEALLKEVMAYIGFINIERLPIDHPYFAESADWQVGCKGTKPEIAGG